MKNRQTKIPMGTTPNEKPKQETNMTLPKRLRLSKFLALATIAIALIFTLVSQDSYAASTEPADQAGPVPEHGSG